MKSRKITICACASRSFIDKEKVVIIAVSLENGGYNVSIEADLCKKIIQKSPEMADIASGTIIACHPRAIRSQFDWLGLEINQTFNLRSSSSEEILDQFQISYKDTENSPNKDIVLEKIKSFPIEEGTDAWTPVLDKERCTECGKCHDFCLFGVYTIENKKVQVTQPQSCKNNCPACARMCPNKAIIFPKYEKSPINGGFDEEETFDATEMDKMYRERLRARLQQRKKNVSLLKKNNE